MNDVDLGAFMALFGEACLKCFGHAVTEPLSETESRLLYTRIFEETGLVVGVKSLKNYSVFVFSPATGKAENPSVATLDSLSRYVMGAPYTTEPERKKTEGHYPYWWRWREGWVQQQGVTVGPEVGVGRRRGWMIWAFIGLALVVVGLTLFFRRTALPEGFRDDFGSVNEDSLVARGWMVRSVDTAFWQRRGATPGCLTLFTLEGDNWPDPAAKPVIHNLLLRRVPCSSFAIECRLTGFLPRQNWQQAGILLSEDTGIGSRSLRVSIAYNDYNGVYPRSGMILLQAIVSQPGSKPLEIAHIPLCRMDSLEQHPALAGNFAHVALRVEKSGDLFRLWYADGELENSSFREIAHVEMDLDPHYAGLLALKGFVDSSQNMPVRFSSFRLECGKGK